MTDRAAFIERVHAATLDAKPDRPLAEVVEHVRALAALAFPGEAIAGLAAEAAAVLAGAKSVSTRAAELVAEIEAAAPAKPAAEGEAHAPAPADGLEEGTEAEEPPPVAAAPPPRPVARPSWQKAGLAAEPPKPPSRAASMLADAARQMGGAKAVPPPVEPEFTEPARPRPIDARPRDRFGEAWDNDQDAELRRLRLREGLTWDEIGERMGRTGPTCCTRASTLKKLGRWSIDVTDRVLAQAGGGSSLGSAI